LRTAPGTGETLSRPEALLPTHRGLDLMEEQGASPNQWTADCRLLIADCQY
jgi:hypothetical protein